MTDLHIRAEQPSLMELRYPARFKPAHKHAVGATFGEYRVVDLLGTSQYRVECSCGSRRVAKQHELPRLRGCSTCQRNKERALSSDALLRDGVAGWRVLSVKQQTGGRRVHVHCDTCGRRTWTWLQYVKDKPCDHIRQGRRQAMTERRIRGQAVAEKRRAEDEPLVDIDTPWEEDLAAQVIVAMHPGPDGMTLEDIGIVCGVSRQRIEQIFSRAIAKMRLRVRLNRALQEHWEDGADRPVTHWQQIVDYIGGYAG